MSRQRKSVQKKNPDWEANYREIFNAVNDGIFVHDFRTGQILDANHKACEMYGADATQMRRCTIGDLSSGQPPYTQEEAVRRVAHAARGNPILFEWHARRRDGRLFWAEVNLKRTRLSGRECVLAMVRDITRRKMLEDELLQTRKTQLDVIAEMNHHIRNALEQIAFSAHNTRNREAIVNIRSASERIQWALREILPKSSQNNSGPVSARQT